MRRRILLSAFACDPETGSEPHVGWNWARMLADDMDVHVITRRYSLDQFAGDDLTRRVTFHAFDLPFCRRRSHHWRFIKLYYLVWQVLVLVPVWRLNRRFRYDIIQHLTYNAVDMPGLLWLCPGARFVWGPVGGGQAAPESLRAVYGRGWWRERLRRVLKATARYNPVVRAAARRAHLVLFANEETAARLAGLPQHAALLCETAISVSGPRPAGRVRDDSPVRILWLGHVFPRKGLTLAIDAFAAAVAACPPGLALELVVAGDGPALPAARRHAARSAVAGHIRFLGAVRHDTVPEVMQAADLFLFTSVQDTSGNVVLEAMRCVLPVVALDHQGARMLLAGGAGRLVEIGAYAQTAGRLGQAIAGLAADPGARRTLGLAGYETARREHGWERKRVEILRHYAALFDMPRMRR